MIRSYLAQRLYEHDMKLVELAEATGLSKGALSDLYHNMADEVNLDVLNKICTHLEIDVADVLSLEKE
ncbi:helix-turn-helix domain-containing protein [Bacillus solimangrovi]|uniref:HTH cro/C1-type domain-containing protein n=1 Tax=Bacillus solimangrovi TaxID=1305675 RepID=A0A1E5LFB3_9BACI|nr:helix-turn-helix transcriptional regulator [Bacillus solimangrovi]OEH92753.1 hypothetical protein BFG57_01765 [Bacillus solimangrovi]